MVFSLLCRCYSWYSAGSIGDWRGSAGGGSNTCHLLLQDTTIGYR